MKTKKEIKELNFNDYAFFKGCSTTDAKWEFESHFYSNQKELENNLTKSGVPKIRLSDTLPKEVFDFTMRSSSDLDGCSQLDCLCDYYNRGITNQKLKEFSETKGFISALKFTGKYSIVNDILNREQYRKVQGTWLIKNTYMINRWSDKTIEFINRHKWAADLLTLNLFSLDEIEAQVESYNIRKNPEKYSKQETL